MPSLGRGLPAELSLHQRDEAKHDVVVDHPTVHRWASRMLSILASVFRRRKWPVGTSWRMNETYIKVTGQWKKHGRGWLAVLFLSSAASTAQVTHAPPLTLSLGVVPQQTAIRTVHLWSGLLDEVGRRSGYRIALKPAQDIPTFEQRLAAGEFDLVYMNPYEYTVYHRTVGYQAFARDESRLEALIIVRRDSTIQKLSDLRGRTMAFVPAAFAATMLPLAHLRQQGITVTPKFLDSHELAYRAILDDMYPACGGVRQTFERITPKWRAELRVLWAAPPVTPHAIAAHPRVPRAVVEELQRVLLDLKHDAAGREVLKELGFIGIIAAYDHDWDDVRALRIDFDPVLQQTRP